MLHVAIIDDSIDDQKRMNHLLTMTRIKSEIDIYDSISNFIIGLKKYDFLLMDIQLKNEDAIERIDTCINRTDWIIYWTSSKERMQEAFGKSIIGYLLKESTDELLIEKLNNLFYKYQIETITVKTDNGMQQIPIQKIYKVTRENRKVRIYLKNNIISVYDTTLNRLYEEMKDTMLWIDRSIFVNSNKIKALGKNTIIFDNDSEERISYRRIKKVKEEVMEILIRDYD